MSSLCSSFTNVNSKKEQIEDMKMQLLQNELEFKNKLYDLQLQTAAKELQTAAKELDIKTEILNQIKGNFIFTNN